MTPVTFELLAERASRRYRSSGITAWRFARGKLLHDPLYRAVWKQQLVPECGTVIDVGCGQGLMLALLAEASRKDTGETAPTETGMRMLSPRTLTGIELRPRIAEVAREALGQDATILTTDARQATSTTCQAILLFDVLHMMPAADQEALLRSLASSLETGGKLLVREVDASAGWRFKVVKLGNRFKGLVNGYSTRQFHFRTTRDWLALLNELGFTASSQPMSEGTPFGNTLFTAFKK